MPPFRSQLKRYPRIPHGCTRRQFGAVLTGVGFGALLPKQAQAADAPWTVAIVPDPQYLAGDNTGCSMYVRMIQWALDNRNLVVNGTPLNLKGFVQVGDCQNVATAAAANSQEVVAVNAWAGATAANLFVAWCCGNHDYENGASTVDRTKIGHVWRADRNGAWSPANLAARYGSGIDIGDGDFAVWGGVYNDPLFPLSSVNNYIRIQVGSRKILIVSLEFFPRTAVLNWAKGLHDTYTDHEVWVTTHGYMDNFGSRCNRSGFGPATYSLADAPSSNTGSQMWNGSDPAWSGFSQWPRLGLVTCGHWIDGYTQGWVWQARQDVGAAGQNTLQVFCNTQEADLANACASGGPDTKTDVAHLMMLRVWPTSCEAFLVSTNTGTWTATRGVRNSPSPVQLFSAPFAALSSSAPPPAVTIGGVSNAASGQPPVASGSWVSIYGTNLSATTREWRQSDFAGNRLPASLDGVTAKINGKSAAVNYVSPGQLNVQCPTDTAVGPVPVQVTNSYGSAGATVFLQPYAPGFFTFRQKYVAAVHPDGAYVAPVGFFGTAAASRPARPGDILLVYGTGFGPTKPGLPSGELVGEVAPLAQPTALQIWIAGVPAPVEFAGLVLAGEYQFNVVVPSVPDGDQPIVAAIAGTYAQPGVLIPIQN